MLLIDTVNQRLAKTSQRFDPTQNFETHLVSSGLVALRQALLQCDKIYFAQSTMTMLLEKLKHYQETLNEVVIAIGGEENVESTLGMVQRYDTSKFRGCWLEFDKPVSMLRLPISAMFYFQPARYLSTGKDTFQLCLIDQTGDIFDVMECSGIAAPWSFLAPFHRCRLCQYDELGILVPCEGCRHILVVWSEIFSLSMIIAGQYLAALRYEEKIRSGMRREKREHSNKERRIPTKHIFKVIDANEIIIQVPVHAEQQREKEARGSWIVEGEVERVEIRTRPFERTYRHERYRASGLIGTTVKFLQGVKRMQPRKKENLGKHVTKVKASLYEGQHANGKEE